MRQVANTDIHALNQLGEGGPKIVRPRPLNPVSLLISTFGIHLEPDSEKLVENADFHNAKTVQEKQHFFSMFRRILMT